MKSPWTSVGVLVSSPPRMTTVPGPEASMKSEPASPNSCAAPLPWKMMTS